MRVSLSRATGLLALLIAGCSEATGPNNSMLSPGDGILPSHGSTGTVTIVQGDGQLAATGAFTSIDPAIQVRDANGTAIANHPVTCVATPSTARVGLGDSPPSAAHNTTTNSSGTAIVRWRLSTTEGGNFLTCTADGGLSATFRAIATSTGNAPTIVKIQGDAAGQNTGQMRGHPARVNPTIQVQDTDASVLPDVDVTFTPSGDGTASPSFARTGTVASGGTAATVWTLPTTGAATLTVRLAWGAAATQLQNVAAAVFTVTPVVRGTTMTKLQGDASSNPSGTAETGVAGGGRMGPRDPAVQITDAAGAGVSGAEVKFTFSTGSDDCNGNTTKFVATDASGIARTAWCTVGSTTGTRTLTATAGTLSATFTGTATAGAPASMSCIQACTTYTGSVGSTVTPDPTVRVLDANGIGVSGVQVTFDPSGNGVAHNGSNSGNPIVVTTDANGFAAVRWVLATTSGAQTLLATAASGQTYTFNATATAGPVTQLLKINGDNQTAPANTQTPRDPTVQALDQYGNVVNGATITWTATSPSSSRVTPSSLCGGTTTATTNTTGCSDGRAAALWTFGAAGPQVLTASTNNVTATFNGTAQ